MSNSDSFEAQLEQMYERYRRAHLRERLGDLAESMEETLLHQAVAKSFFDETIAIDSDIKQSVQDVSAELDAENYDRVENQLDTLEQDIASAETHVSNRVQELRIDREDTVTAMRRLNGRVNRVDSSQVQALESLLSEWDWKPHVYSDDLDSFTQRRSAAVQYGEDMAHIYDQLQTDLFGRYNGTDLRRLVDKLLDKDRLRLGDLSEAERQQLAESDLTDYVELKLS